MIEFLDAHAGAAQALLALVLIVVTAYYAWQTRQQVNPAKESIDEMRTTRDLQAKAYVTLELWPWDRNMDLFDLAIRNHGSGGARDIRVVFEPGFSWPMGGIGASGNVNDIEVFQDLPFLGPHDEFLLFAGMARLLAEPSVPENWTGHVEFTDDTGRQKVPFRLNMRRLTQIQCMLPYGEPGWAPPIRRGWGRSRERDQPMVGTVKA